MPDDKRLSASKVPLLASPVLKGAVPALILAFSPAAFAQLPVMGASPAHPAPSMETAATLSGVVERTLLSHPEVRAKYHEFQSALEGQTAARGAYFPRVNATASYGHEHRHGGSGLTSQKWEGFGNGLELRQIIFDGFRTRNDVKQAGFEKLARFYDVLAVSDATAFAAVEAYVDLQRYRQLESLARQNLALHEDTLSQIGQRVRAGVGRRVDLEQASGRRALAHSNLMTETANLRDVQQRFLRITGMLPAEVLQPVPEIADRLPVRPDSFNESLRRNPDILSKQATLQAAQAGIASSKGAFSPTFELVASTGLGQAGSPSGQRDVRGSSVEVVMRYNLFSGGSDSARVRQTTAQSYAARDIRDYTCRNVQQDLAVAWSNIISLNERLPFLREHEAATSKVRDAYRQQFRIGERSLMDLLDTENELFDARRVLANAAHDVKLAQYRWLSLSHGLLPVLSLQSVHEDAPEENGKLEMPDEAIGYCLSSMPDYLRPAQMRVQHDEGALPPAKLFPVTARGTER